MDTGRAEMARSLNQRLRRGLCVGLVGVMGAGLAGCETADEHRTATGAIVGTLVGATAGALLAGDDDRGKGALIGGVAGAAVGGGIGYVLQRQKEKFNEIEGVEASEETVYVPAPQEADAPTVDESGALDDTTWESGEGSTGEARTQEVSLVPAQGLTMTLTEQLLFPVDSSALTPEGTRKVGEIADVLKEFPESDVFVMGYTSSDGNDAYNVSLSQRRADAVKNTLVANQISPYRITSLGMGSSNPVASNDTQAGRLQNRRVEIVVVPRKSAA